MKIKDFEDLECWQQARKFVNIIYDLTRKESFRKDYMLVDQIRRAAVSTMSNIVEGFYRYSNKEFIRFLDISRSSLGESISHLYVALDQNYVNQKEFSETREQGKIVFKQLNSFIAYLHKFEKQKKSMNPPSS